MPETIAQPPEAPRAVSDTTRLARARVLVGSAVGACVFYGYFTRSSRGSCTGDVPFEDAAATEFARVCSSVTLVPSELVYLVVALIVMRAMTVALHHSATTDDALRTLVRARRLVIGIAIGSLVLAHAWFAAIPVGDPWAPTGNAVRPSLIAWVDVDVTTYP